MIRGAPLLLICSLLAGCAGPDLAVRSGDHGQGVSLGGGRVATAEHVTARSGRLDVRGPRGWVGGRTVERHQLATTALGFQDALVVVQLEGDAQLADPPPFRRLGPGDSGTALYDAQGRCVGIYLGRHWGKGPEEGREARTVGIFAPPRPEWVTAP